MEDKITIEEILLRDAILDELGVIKYDGLGESMSTTFYRDDEGRCWIKHETTIAPEINNSMKYLTKDVVNKIIELFK